MTTKQRGIRESIRAQERLWIVYVAIWPVGVWIRGSEGCHQGIRRCVRIVLTPSIHLKLTYLTSSRKSDIENERLPPELFDADSEEGKAYLASTTSQPSTPAETSAEFASNGLPAENLSAAIQAAAVPSSPTSPESPGKPVLSPINPLASPPSGSPSPTTPTGAFRRGHGRNASLGTTMTSPSTRRRSLESTMSLIQGVWEGQDAGVAEQAEESMEAMTDKLSQTSVR